MPKVQTVATPGLPTSPSPAFFPLGPCLPGVFIRVERPQPPYGILHRRQVLVSPGRYHRALSFGGGRAEGRVGTILSHLCPLVSVLHRAWPTQCSVNVERMSDVNYPSWNSPECECQDTAS